MAQAYNYYSADGGTDSFEFTQELSDQSVVVGYVDWVLTSGTWDSGTGFYTFDATPVSGADIHIVRSTSNNTMVATFPNKSYITSDNLDADHRQHLLQVQELEFMDMLLNYLMGGGALTAAAAAAASAAAAATSETNAATSETNAATSETNAAASEAAAAATLANAVLKDGSVPMDSTADLTFSGGGAPTGLPATPGATEASSKEYVDTQDGLKVAQAGDTMDSAANLTFAGGGEVLGLPATPSATAASSKEYVDAQVAAGGTGKNVLINGNFNIWQRGTSFAAIASATYTTDRWEYAKTGIAVHTVSRSTDVPTYAQSGVKSNYSLLLDCTTADTSIAASDTVYMNYHVEGYDYAQLAGGDATLSFWVKGTKTGIHCVSFSNSAWDRTYVAEYTINTTDTWEKKTITVPLTETGGTWDYTNGIGLKIGFAISCGTTFQTTKDAWQTGLYVATSNQVNATDNVANNFRIAQIQLVKGDVDTPFEFNSFVEELARCQRYCQVTDDNKLVIVTTAVGNFPSWTFPTTMRVTPTMTFTFTAGTGATFAVGRTAFYQNGNHTVDATFDFTADAEL